MHHIKIEQSTYVHNMIQNNQMTNKSYSQKRNSNMHWIYKVIELYYTWNKIVALKNVRWQETTVLSNYT